MTFSPADLFDATYRAKVDAALETAREQAAKAGDEFRNLPAVKARIEREKANALIRGGTAGRDTGIERNPRVSF